MADSMRIPCPKPQARAARLDDSIAAAQKQARAELAKAIEEARALHERIVAEKEIELRQEEQHRLEREALQKEIAHFRETNALMSQERTRLTSLAGDAKSSQAASAREVRELRAELNQLRHDSSALKRDLECFRTEAATEQDRLSKLLAEAQAQLETERQAGQGKEEEHVRHIALLERSCAGAGADAEAAQKEAELLTETFTQERDQLTEQLKGLQEQCAALMKQQEDSVHVSRPVPGCQISGPPSSGSQEAIIRVDESTPMQRTLPAEIAERILALKSQDDERLSRSDSQRGGLGALRRKLRSWIGRAAENEDIDQSPLNRRLRDLTTEALPEHEHERRDAAEQPAPNSTVK